MGKYIRYYEKFNYFYQGLLSINKVKIGISALQAFRGYWKNIALRPPELLELPLWCCQCHSNTVTCQVAQSSSGPGLPVFSHCTPFLTRMLINSSGASRHFPSCEYHLLLRYAQWFLAEWITWSAQRIF